MKKEVTVDLKAEKGEREERKKQASLQRSNRVRFHLKVRSFLPWVNFQTDSFIVLGRKTTTTTLLKKLLLCKYRIETLF